MLHTHLQKILNEAAGVYKARHTHTHTYVPMSKEQWLHGRRRAERSYSTLKVRRGGCEEIPLFQGKEQRLCFAGAAVKRYPMPKVREIQVGW